jgi:putative ABC transport system permease protein
LKGLVRDRARSLFPAVTVIAGVTLTVLLQTYLGGLIANMGSASASFSTGHVKVTSRAYAREGDQSPNELAYSGVGTLVEELRQQYPQLVWTPRTRFAGLLDVPDDRGLTRAQAPMVGFAVNLTAPDSPERQLLNLEKSLVRGRLPAKPREALVSDDLARQLGVEPGATATLISSTMYGSMATSNFTIVGTVRFGVRSMDRGAMIADLADIQTDLDMSDTAGEVLGLFRDSLYHMQEAEIVAKAFNDRHASSRDEFAPTMVTMHAQPGIGEMMDYMGAVSAGAIAIFTFVMSIVLWNTGLVGGLRRYGEIGVRLAFGEDRRRLYHGMLVESLAIGLVGSIAGTVLALVPAYWLQQHGFDAEYLLKNSSMMVSSVLRTQVTPFSFVVGFIPGLLATLVGTAISGTGIFKRQTATLMKELEA